METDEICCICLEKIENEKSKTLNCTHKFHDECINSWISYKNIIVSVNELQLECPLCRANELIKINNESVDDIIYNFSLITFYKRRQNLMIFCFITSITGLLSLVSHNSPASIITIAVSFYGLFGAIYMNVSLLFYYLLLNVLDYIIKLFIIYQLLVTNTDLVETNYTKNFTIFILLFILFVHTYVIYITYYLRKNILKYHEYIKEQLNNEQRHVRFSI